LTKKQQLTRICGRQNNLEEIDDLIINQGGSSSSTYEVSHWTMDSELDPIPLSYANAGGIRPL
jgi:hypothetical protein